MITISIKQVMHPYGLSYSDAHVITISKTVVSCEILARPIVSWSLMQSLTLILNQQQLHGTERSLVCNVHHGQKVLCFLSAPDIHIHCVSLRMFSHGVLMNINFMFNPVVNEVIRFGV